MAEQFALHQFGGDRATVHGYKGAFGPRAEGVDHAGDDFLATAGFATDIHRRLAAGEFLQARAQLSRITGVSPSSCGWSPTFRLLAAASFSALWIRPRSFQVDGFGHEVEGAGLEGLDGGIHAAVGADHGDWGLGV